MGSANQVDQLLRTILRSIIQDYLADTITRAEAVTGLTDDVDMESALDTEDKLAAEVYAAILHLTHELWWTRDSELGGLLDRLDGRSDLPSCLRTPAEEIQPEPETVPELVSILKQAYACYQANYDLETLLRKIIPFVFNPGDFPPDRLPIHIVQTARAGVDELEGILFTCCKADQPEAVSGAWAGLIASLNEG